MIFDVSVTNLTEFQALFSSKSRIRHFGSINQWWYVDFCSKIRGYSTCAYVQ